MSRAPGANGVGRIPAAVPGGDREEDPRVSASVPVNDVADGAPSSGPSAGLTAGLLRNRDYPVFPPGTPGP
ncbi:hypothetical protein, partial [Streptosporangium sp. NPDC048865]|uniref:hypothetical protein n=1 Tax=Streptosporangium sp. NPDC048865 TaxID=3155766 RepID=UPI003442BBCA